MVCVALLLGFHVTLTSGLSTCDTEPAGYSADDCVCGLGLEYSSNPDQCQDLPHDENTDFVNNWSSDCSDLELWSGDPVYNKDYLCESIYGSAEEICCYCGGGTIAQSCLPCPENEFKNIIGDTSCTQVPSNSVSNTERSDFLCLPGYYRSEDQCDACPEGKYSTTQGATSSNTCINCVAGKYQASTGKSECNICPENTYSTSEVPSSECTQCDSGTYSIAQSTSCTSCDVGFYFKTTGTNSGSCHECTPLCGRGYYRIECGHLTEGRCIACETGKYKITTGPEECTTCDKGKYSTTIGGASSSVCLNCDPGTYSMVEAATTCEICATCPAGQYSTGCGDNSEGSCESCQTCGVDQYLSGCTGTFPGECQSCEVCTAGQYSTGCGGTSQGSCESCASCPAGQYSAGCEGTSQGSCELCDTGKYSTGEGGNTATTPLPNTTTTEGDLKLTNCGKHHEDFSGDVGNQSTCCLLEIYHDNEWGTICDRSWETYDNANIACKQLGCSGGVHVNKFSNAYGKMWMDEVICQGTESSLSDCAFGGWGMHNCNSGPESYNRDVGVCCFGVIISGGIGGTGSCPTTCTICESGKYQDESGQSACLDCTTCSEGQYNTGCGGTSEGSCQSCQTCRVGQYLSGCTGTFAGICESCEVCTAGQYSTGCGGTSQGSCESCASCPAGQYRTGCGPWTSPGSCELCDVGKYSTGEGATTLDTCTICQSGKYQDESGQSVCLDCGGCDPGTYRFGCDGQSEGSCSACEAGKYKTTSETEACSDCASCGIGQYRSELCSGSSAGLCDDCGACESGKYESEACSDTSPVQCTACASCPVGQYRTGCEGTSQGECTSCPAGTFKSLEYSTECLPCAVGSYSAASASICSMCTAGKYSTVGAQSCTDSPRGTYSLGGASEFIPCPPGTYASQEGSFFCTPCPFNTFSDAESATSETTCQACAEGKYASTAMTVCSECSAGSRVVTWEDIEVCVECSLEIPIASATDFNQACSVACSDDECVKAIMTTSNTSHTLSMREHIEQVYGSNMEIRRQIQEALDSMIGTWEHTQLDLNTTDWYAGHTCKECGTITDPHNNQLVPLNAYSVTAQDDVCAVTCDVTKDYYKRASHPNTCVKCETECGTGQYLTGDTCNDCWSCEPPVAEHYNFTGRGTLDDNASCAWRCDSGYFLDYVFDSLAADAAVVEACVPHTTVSCDAGQYQVLGTHVSDAYCEECTPNACEGRRMTAACSLYEDAHCEDCPASALETGATYVHSNCTRACVDGFVPRFTDLQSQTFLCEPCDHECTPGSFFPIDRQNCTDCRTCPDTIPDNASFVDACAWACDDGFFYTQEACKSLAQNTIQAPHGDTLCAEGERLVWGSTTYQCEPCGGPIPATPPDTTWRWLPSRSSCAWECLPGYYRAPFSATLVDCLAWDAYQMQIIGNPAAHGVGDPVSGAVSAIAINNVAEIKFEKQEREYDTLSLAEFGLLAGFVFGALMVVMLTQT